MDHEICFVKHVVYSAQMNVASMCPTFEDMQLFTFSGSPALLSSSTHSVTSVYNRLHKSSEGGHQNARCLEAVIAMLKPLSSTRQLESAPGLKNSENFAGWPYSTRRRTQMMNISCSSLQRTQHILKLVSLHAVTKRGGFLAW